jgi:hypothetical protein
MAHNGKILFIVIVTLACVPAQAYEENPFHAPGAWKLSITPQFSYGSYNNSPTRDTVASTGVAAEFDYLERGGVSLSATNTDLKLLQDMPTVKQSSGTLAGYMNLTPDVLPGRLNMRAEILHADNNDVTNETNAVNAFAPRISFLNYAKTFYLDIGYAVSGYGDSYIGNGTLTVKQLTPTIGFGFNAGADWLQLRAFNIRVSNALRAQNLSGTNANELQWTHYLASRDEWMPQQLQIGAVFGKRIYAVDAGSIYNFADIQQGGAALGMQWALAEDAYLSLSGGQDRYDAGGGVVYTASHVYLGMGKQW